MIILHWYAVAVFAAAGGLVGAGLTLLVIRFRVAPRMVEAAIADYLLGVASSAPRKERTTVGELIEARRTDEAS